MEVLDEDLLLVLVRWEEGVDLLFWDLDLDSPEWDIFAWRVVDGWVGLSSFGFSCSVQRSAS